MWALLNWLYGVAERVYEFFSTLYYKIKRAALNAWSWANDARNRAISWALDKVIDYYNKAKAWVNTYIRPIADAAWAKAVDAYNSILIWYNDLRGKVIRWIDEAKISVRNWVEAKIREINTWAQSLIPSMKRWVDNLEAKISQRLLLIAEFFADPWTVLSAFDHIGLIAFMIQLKERSGPLFTFIDNPLEWTAAYVGSFLLTMLEYQVAYALGTEKAILPPPPDWNGGGRGGPLPRGPGPPPDASPLAPPLSYLRVSGYKFGPGHWATDFGCTADMAIYACHDGTVKVSGFSTIGYGNYIIIASGEWWTLYAHLSRLGVGVGQTVSARQPIGMCGCVGNSTCNHLHLEIKHYGKYLDPVVVFGL